MYSKLTDEKLQKRKGIFTTIRREGPYWRDKFYAIVPIIVNGKKLFDARIVGIKSFKKEELSEKFAWGDADCTAAKLVNDLERWYGSEFDDFIKIILREVSYEEEKNGR
jgi:hypothetical protein